MRSQGGGGGATAGASAGASGGQGGFSQNMATGSSIVSTLSSYAEGKMKVEDMRREAFSEGLAMKQEFIDATERTNAIQAEYNKIVGDQMASASGGGIDVGSGSVVEARNQLRDDAARETRRINNAADLNASVRKARMIKLRENAKTAEIYNILNAAVSIGSAFVKPGG